MAGPRKASFPRQGLRGERGVYEGLNAGGQAERGEHQRKLVSLLLSLDGGAAVDAPIGGLDAYGLFAAGKVDELERPLPRHPALAA